MDLMPTSFFKGEVVVGSKRHLIFMTDEQLALLKTAVRWYADGTFKIINFPFTQLFSLHGLKKEWAVKAGSTLFCVYVGKDSKRLPQGFRKDSGIVGW